MHVQGETTQIPIGDCVGRDEELRTTVNNLARQMMLQQLFVEEKSRSDGDSGLKSIRLSNDGTQPYYANSHVSWSVAAIHDHPDHMNTVGMGELLAVLNGVEFRTRHNDYTLYKPR
ncbi:uncharacterized protein LOC106011538 [Aplysia californica]|uniref:Uncharacterized protein LOC106011538 n=1 Tax=Aplysia californica TaxID=6500 RepID=A0ABM0ZYA9_APLCA|nr:uncharacterized protein LOC106011538 [Aplysia californica]